MQEILGRLDRIIELLQQIAKPPEPEVDFDDLAARMRTGTIPLSLHFRGSYISPPVAARLYGITILAAERQLRRLVRKGKLRQDSAGTFGLPNIPER